MIRHSDSSTQIREITTTTSLDIFYIAIKNSFREIRIEFIENC